MIKLNKQIRTCVCCRGKFKQFDLLRLQCVEKNLVMFNNNKGGRSFYLCVECLENENKLQKSLYKQCRNKGDYIVQLKEILIIWKK